MASRSGESGLICPGGCERGKSEASSVGDGAEDGCSGDLASKFTECANGAEAVAAFAQQRPDWTIMDITMKGMNGLEATCRIQKQFGGARIVMLTQHDTPQMRAAALEAGACAFVSKDNLAELAAILRNQNRP